MCIRDRNLLEEGIPVRDMRTIAQALAENAGKSQDIDALTAAVRVSLGSNIYQAVNGTARELSVMALDTQLEQILQGAIQGSSGGLEPSLIERTIKQIVEAAGMLEAEGKTPVLLVASNIRLFLSRLLRSTVDNFYVLAYDEVPASKKIKAVATIGAASALSQQGAASGSSS